jgi:hypothetical protein
MRRSCPWAEAERRPGVQVREVLLPTECGGAAVQRRGDHIWVLIDQLGSPVEQRCRLAHELVHLDRGSSLRCRWSPTTWDVVVAREEQRVDEEVARWLVPDRALWELVGAMVAAGEDVTTVAIAEHFQVTRPLARLALERLARARSTMGTVEAWAS